MKQTNLLDALKKWRKGKTQADAAKRLGVSTRTLQRWIEGETTPSKADQARIADVVLDGFHAVVNTKKKQAKRKPPKWVHVTPTQVRELRDRPEWTNAKLAKSLGVSMTSISNWIGGVSVATVKTQKKLRKLIVGEQPPKAAKPKATKKRPRPVIAETQTSTAPTNVKFHVGAKKGVPANGGTLDGEILSLIRLDLEKGNDPSRLPNLVREIREALVGSA